MPWLRLEANFRTHPKVKALARILGVRRTEARGILTGLWAWCLDYAVDGDLNAFEVAEIEDGADWEGAPGACFEALVSCRFIDTDEDDKKLHDWMDYAGSYKAAVQKRKQRRRETVRGRSADGPRNVLGDVRTDQTDVSDETGRRESEPPPALFPPAPPPPDLFISLPCRKGSRGVDRERIAFHVTRPDVERMKKTYVSIDVPYQLRRIAEWALSKPTKAKTYSGWPAALNRWLSSEEEKARTKTGGVAVPIGAKPIPKLRPPGHADSCSCQVCRAIREATKTNGVNHVDS